jgi:hypothetical protein
MSGAWLEGLDGVTVMIGSIAELAGPLLVVPGDGVRRRGGLAGEIVVGGLRHRAVGEAYRDAGYYLTAAEADEGRLPGALPSS